MLKTLIDSCRNVRTALRENLRSAYATAVSAYAGVLLTPLLTPPYAIAGFAYAASI